MGIFGDRGEKRVHRIGNPNRRSVTAAGQRVDKKKADELRRLIQPWQSRALTYYDIVPEIKYAGQFYSRALKKIRIYAAELDENGEPQETTDPDVIAQVERIKDPGGGGRSGLQASYGRLIFLTGEAYCFVSVDPVTEVEQWEMLSSDELRVNAGGQYTRFKAPSLAAEEYMDPPDEAYELAPGEAVVYRLWNKHPRYSALADSTMQGVLDVCEELVLLTQAIRSRAKSRLAGAGLLLVNGSVFPVDVDPDTSDENPEEDDFLTAFTDAMIAPISDEGAASAVVPLVLRVDAEKLDDVIKHIQIIDPMQLYPETGLRNECRDRLAIGLDMPPEALLGTADANHWTAWQIDEQTWKAHLQPVAQGMVDDLTASFLQPTLREAGKDNWQKYVIAYDAADVINHPDRTRDAKDLHALDALSDAALREYCGFDDDDAITDEKEWWRRVGVKLRDPSYVKYGEPAVARGGVMTGPEDLLGVNQDSVSNTEVDKAPPEQPTDKEQPTPVSAGGLPGLNGMTNVAKVIGASDLALHRARELAGSRIRSKAQRDVEARLKLDGVRNGQVAAALGPDKVKALMKQSPEQLVSGAAETLLETFRLWKVEGDDADVLVALVERHAAATLFHMTPSPLPDAYMHYVVGLHEAEKV